ncbi:hypothetical protein SAMN06297421_11130 [Aristaeella hokkaidonensis]|nr:hypothetical protein SAMN06297421_11130 [Aristaeella hokkaidonensis]
MPDRYTEPSIQYLTFDRLLQEQGYIVYTSVGYSMMPLLRQHKDIIVIHKLDKQIKKYDVVLYKIDDRYILHRVLKVLPDRYVVAGDHNTFLDPPVMDDMILGVMTRVIRDGKSITPDNIWYKVYVHLWCDFYPVRVFLLKTKSFVYRYWSAVKRRVFG